MNNQKLKKLEARKAKIAAEIARVRGREAAAARRQDTRRKIIVGAVILGMVERGEGMPKNALFAALDKSLSRPQDRALFYLPPLAPARSE